MEKKNLYLQYEKKVATRDDGVQFDYVDLFVEINGYRIYVKPADKTSKAQIYKELGITE